MMKEDYSKLKERAGHRGEWRHWTYEPTCLGRQRTKKKHCVYIASLTCIHFAISFTACMHVSFTLLSRLCAIPAVPININMEYFWPYLTSTPNFKGNLISYRCIDLS